MESVVVLLSGGVASAVAAYRRAGRANIHPLYIDYGRASADAEREAAEVLAEALDLRLKVLDLPHVRQIAEAQHGRLPSGQQIPLSAVGGPGDVAGLAATLLAVGAQYAAAVGAHVLVTGQMAAPFDAGQTLSRERTVDPHEFHRAFGAMLEAALPAVRAVRLDTPLIGLQPFEVVKLAVRFAVPFEYTWSCHRTPPPCGTCFGCKTRAAAFAQAAVVDPLLRPAGT